MSKYAITLWAFLSPWAASPSQAQDLLANDTLAEVGFYRYWQAQLPLKENDEVLELRVVDENLYAITDQADLFAIHADIGVLRWSVNLGGPGTRIFEPTHVRSFWGKDLTLVSTSDRIHWLDSASGKSVAKLSVDFIPTTAAVSDGRRVYVGGLDSMLHCIELVPTASGVATTRKWRIRTGALTTTTPVLWGGGLFFASQDGKVRACDSLDKTRFWVFGTAKPNSADIYVDSTGVYFGSEDRSIYKVDVGTGRGLWRFRTPGTIRTSPVLLGDKLYQEVENQGVYVVNTDTGEQAWHAPSAARFISASPQQAYLLTQYGDILAVDAQTGSVQGQIVAGNVDLVGRNPANSAMYLASRSGRILCAQDKSVPFLRFEQLQRSNGGPAEAAKPAANSEPEAVAQRPALVDLLRSRSDATALSNQD